VSWSRSILNDPNFQYYAFLIFLLLACAVSTGYKNGGLLAGIIAGLQGIQNLVIGFIFAVVVLLMVLSYKKWEIIGRLIWDWIRHKKI
jgi:hypothetical protein